MESQESLEQKRQLLQVLAQKLSSSKPFEGVKLSGRISELVSEIKEEESSLYLQQDQDTFTDRS
jgi:hypothetical protein